MSAIIPPLSSFTPLTVLDKEVAKGQRLAGFRAGPLLLEGSKVLHMPGSLVTLAVDWFVNHSLPKTTPTSCPNRWMSAQQKEVEVFDFLEEDNAQQEAAKNADDPLRSCCTMYVHVRPIRWRIGEARHTASAAVESHVRYPYQAPKHASFSLLAPAVSVTALVLHI